MSQPPRGHELVEHTADVGLRVWAPTLDELFSEGALGLIDVMGQANGPADRREQIELEASDLEALLADWLSEVLFWFDARELVPRNVRVSVDRERNWLHADIDAANASTFVQHGPAVKAVTYHAIQLSETEAGFEARVYLDV